MSLEGRTWPPEVVARIQAILDGSAATATPVVGRVFARPDWRLDAREFLELWNATRACSVATTSPGGAPHIARISAAFDERGRLTMRMYEGSMRQRDIEANPRLALQMATADGAVLTVYGRARLVADSYLPNQTTPGTPGSHEVEVQITRIYAMRPRRPAQDSS